MCVPLIIIELEIFISSTMQVRPSATLLAGPTSSVGCGHKIVSLKGISFKRASLMLGGHVSFEDMSFKWTYIFRVIIYCGRLCYVGRHIS